jgi:antitoxin MazE
MRVHIVKAGNSWGLRIPRALLEQTGLRGAVEITAREGCLVVGPAHQPRAAWEARFREISRRGDDQLLDDGWVLSNPAAPRCQRPNRP